MVTAMGTVTRTKHCNEAPPVPLGWGCFVFPSCPMTGRGLGVPNWDTFRDVPRYLRLGRANHIRYRAVGHPSLR